MVPVMTNCALTSDATMVEINQVYEAKLVRSIHGVTPIRRDADSPKRELLT